MRAFANAAVLAPLLGLVAAPARAQVASALLRVGDTVAGAPPGHVVAGFHNTAANRVGGHAATILTDDGLTTLSHVWGSATGGPGTLLVSETAGVAGYDQITYEGSFGMDDAGHVAYSPICDDLVTGVTDLDSVWIDLTPIATEGQPIATLPGRRFRSIRRPGLTAAGTAYWVGEIRSNTGADLGNGLFAGAGQLCLLKTGDPAPAPLTSNVRIASGADVRFSGAGTHSINIIETTDSPVMDSHVVIDGALALSSGGTAMSEGTSIPPGSGGIGGELWEEWDFVGITETGAWMVSGDTNGAGATDGILVRNGRILHREGDVVDGVTLVGKPRTADMGASGEIAYVWGMAPDPRALFYESTLLLQPGDAVDWTGDGVVDPGFTVLDFTGNVTLGSSSVGGPSTYLLFTAIVLVGGSGEEGFFRIPVAPPGAAFCAGDGLDPAVTTPCPCGNTGAPGHGCASSILPQGGLLSAAGTTHHDSVVLAGSSMPLTVACIYLQGDAPDDVVFGDGVRCAGGTLLRLRTVTNVGGASSFPDSVETVTLSQRGGVLPGSGAVRYYQTYYRNAAALFCPPDTFNVTNGWRVTW